MNLEGRRKVWSRQLAFWCLLGAVACRSATSAGRKPPLAEGPEAAQDRAQRLLAVTVDDLPWVGRLAPGETPEQANRRLLKALTSRGLHATGFVVCDNLETGDAILGAWLDSGMELGNHTSRHLDLHGAGLTDWVADVERCHQRLSRSMPEPPGYFRYPYLHRGDSAEKHAGAAAALARLGYEPAPVTVDNSEWLLADAYGQALERGDRELTGRLAKRYATHLLAGIEHFDRVGRAELGRVPPHVLLVHANALAADHLGAVLDEVAARGIRVVPLGVVLEDPLFAREDTYLGPKGLSWLYRLSPGAFERWGAWDDAEASRIRKHFFQESG